jgi:hypothetical protein
MASKWYMRKSYKILVEKSKQGDQMEDLNVIQENNIKMNVT